MKMSKTASIILVVVLLAAGFSLYHVLKNRTPFSERKPAVNELAPEIALADLSGKMLRLSELKGKVVLLNFWASWCPPCKAELSEFQKVYETHGDKGFEVVALAIDEIPASLVMEMRLSFPVAVVNKRVSRDYGDIANVPASFLIDKEGRIIKKINEVYPTDRLIQDVENALKGDAGTGNK